MILITDGENLTGDPEVALQEAADAQMVIITAGIGTMKGATIPVTVNNEKTEKKDEEGKTVITRLQPAVLKKIAESGHGIYTEPGASLTISIDAVVNQINGISKEPVR
jgi:Ca-activated chloride channel family protein